MGCINQSQLLTRIQRTYCHEQSIKSWKTWVCSTSRQGRGAFRSGQRLRKIKAGSSEERLRVQMPTPSVLISEWLSRVLNTSFIEKTVLCQRSLHSDILVMHLHNSSYATSVFLRIQSIHDLSVHISVVLPKTLSEHFPLTHAPSVLSFP